MQRPRVYDEDEARLHDPEVERVELLTLEKCYKERKRRVTARDCELFHGEVGMAFNGRVIALLDERIEILQERE